MPRSSFVDAFAEVSDVIHFMEVDNFAPARLGVGHKFIFGCVQSCGGFTLEE
jgi:hypothetical protein